MAEVVSSITLGQLWASVLLISVICSTISKIIEALYKVLSKAKKPEEIQNQRISALETKVAELKTMLTKDDTKLKDFEESNKITQRALLALLKHGIDGNDVDAMKDARDDLERYLINR